MSKYLIRLTPIGKFFFGGEIGFQVGADKNDDHNKSFSSYIIQSNYFPQQTSLLGMLRFLILSNSEAFDKSSQKIKNAENAKKIIGESSFAVKESHERSDFGEIKNISQCFLQIKKAGKEWENLILAPADYGYSITIDEKLISYINGKKKSISKIEVFSKPKNKHDKKVEKLFSAKEGLSTQFLSYEGKHSPLIIDDIFIEDIRIGINRNIKTGETEENDLFKQISYRFNNKKIIRTKLIDADLKETERIEEIPQHEYSFAFVAEVENDLKKYDKQIISIGGDNSQFIFNVKSFNDETVLDLCRKDVKINENYNCYGKVVLKSPTYITQDELNLSCFAIADTISFRFLESNVSAKNYSILHTAVRRSNTKYSLYKAGSVFYFSEKNLMDDFVIAIEAKQDFRQIGYNQYQQFPNNK